MKIIRSRKYQIHLLVVLQHIAKDKVSASKNFLKELDTSILNIKNFPYKNIRDLIYRKYTINYEINLEDNSIEILNIFNQNKPSEVQ